MGGDLVVVKSYRRIYSINPVGCHNRHLTGCVLGWSYLMKMVKRLIENEKGVETSEYALMLVFISLALILAIYVLRGAIANGFRSTAALFTSGT